MAFLNLLCKQGVTGSIPVTSTNYLPTNQSVANLAFARLHQIWEHLGTTDLPIDSRPVSERSRWPGCTPEALSTYVSGRVEPEPLVKAFLARGATCVCRSECQSIDPSSAR